MINSMSNKEKLNNITVYLIFHETELKNNLIEKHNQMIIRTDTYNVLEYYKAKAIYESFQEISKDIEKILY